MGNREIKFRAWDVVVKQMVYYGAFQFEQFPKQPLAPQDVRQRIFPFDGIESGEMITKDCLNGWNLMQFTGLLDKNGKEIYEGDIVKYLLPDPRYEEDPETFTEFVEAVTFQDGTFQVEAAPLYATLDWKVEIIGSIYENPELLK